MRKIQSRIIFAVAVSVLLSLTSCRDVTSLSITSCEVTSILPAEDGFDVGLAFGVTNPHKRIELSSTSGRIYAKNAQVATFTADAVTIPGKCVAASCPVLVHLKPDPGQTILSLMKLRSYSAGDFTFDIESKARYGILPAKSVHREGLKIKDFIDKL